MLKLALLQISTQWENKNANLSMALDCINSTDAELVVLPEMFTTGFTMNVAQMAETMDGESVSWMRSTAARTGKAIMGSVIIRETVEGRDVYFNRLIFALPTGDIKHYDKRHLFRMGGEQGVFTCGERRVVIEYKGFRILPVICYDLRFPVWSRNRSDYDLMIDVACWPRVRSLAWSTLLRARAIENLCYVAGANMVGSDPNVEYSGDSVIVDFLGQPMAEATEPVQQIVCATLDMDKLRAFRDKFPAHLDADNFNIEL